MSPDKEGHARVKHSDKNLKFMVEVKGKGSAAANDDERPQFRYPQHLPISYDKVRWIIFRDGNDFCRRD